MARKGIWSLHGISPGDLYTTDGKDVWVVESFCEHPTIDLRQLNGSGRIGGAVGSLNVQDFVRLVPETEVSDDPS